MTKSSSFLMGAVCSCLFTAGGKLWRLKYRFQAKEKLLTLGAYPDISLKDARKKRDAKELLAKDIDPAEVKREAKATAAALELEMATTFEAVAREWLSKKRHAWTPGHQKKILSRLENQLFPIFGAKPFLSLEPGNFLAAIQKAESRDAIETATTLRNSVGRFTAMPALWGLPNSERKRSIANERADRPADQFTDLIPVLSESVISVD